MKGVAGNYSDFVRVLIVLLYLFSTRGQTRDGMSFVGYPPQPVAAGYFYPPYGLIPPGGPPQVASPYSVPLQGPIEVVPDPSVVVVPPPAEDHPDLYIPEEVKMFLPYFRGIIVEKKIPEILAIYENEFNRLSDRYFKEFPWPEAQQVAPLVEDDHVFLILYKELRYRHIYAKHKPTIEHRFESYDSYCDFFNMVLNTPDPISLELPNQWLWDIIDEFLYQFQTFIQFRGKLNSRSAEEIQLLKDNSKSTWNIHSVLNILYSLVEKSNINQQLKAFNSGEDPAAVAGSFGSQLLYKNLGYFSLIGLLRLHTQLGDYHTAQLAVVNVQLSKKVLATTRVPASQIALHYYLGFCYFMTRKYRDTVRVFSNILVFIQRVKQHFQPKSYQLDLVVKQNDQMLWLLAIVLSLYPQHVDEVVNSQLKDRKFQEDLTKLQQGDLATYKKLFTTSCPKFISPVPPDYDALPDNYTRFPSEHQCSVFMKEVEPQLIVPVIRSYLKFYTTMPVAKLALFMDKEESLVREYLLRFKHKCRTVALTSPNSPEAQSVSDIDFYIDGEMIHIADTKVARRYGDYFLRQIHKLQDMMNK